MDTNLPAWLTWQGMNLASYMLRLSMEAITLEKQSLETSGRKHPGIQEILSIRFTALHVSQAMMKEAGRALSPPQLCS